MGNNSSTEKTKAFKSSYTSDSVDLLNTAGSYNAIASSYVKANEKQHEKLLSQGKGDGAGARAVMRNSLDAS